MNRRLWIVFALAAFLFGALPADAQNTKGDKPVSNQAGQFLHIPRVKSKKKGGDRPYTSDITGRKRIRTKSMSSAATPIYKQWNPYADRKQKRGDHPAQPRGRVFNQPPRGRERAWKGTRDGSPLRVRSVSARQARQNVYPQVGPYVNNQSTLRQRPKVYTRTSTGKQIYRSRPSRHDRANYGGGGYNTVSRPFIVRGRKNVYWGKFSKGERPVTTDLAGKPLRNRNFRSLGGGVGVSDTIIFAHKRPRGDRAIKAAPGGLSVPQFGEKAWKGDVSGHKIRRRPPRRGPAAGRLFYPRKFSVSGKGEHVGQPLHRGKNNVSVAPGNAPLPTKGGGSVSGKFFNNGGRPIDVRGPGIGSRGIGNFKGKFLRDEISPQFSHAGGGYQGNFKTRRPPKGGGSISGRSRNNQGQPIPPRLGAPGFERPAHFKGNFFRDEIAPEFGRQGYRFSGNIKSRGPLKGGGSVSGKLWNNNGEPIPPRLGAAGFERPAHFKGNFFRDEIAPEFGRQGYRYSGNIKSKRPLKGGGSVSGRLWNNHGDPIPPRLGAPGFEKPAHFKGNFFRDEIAPEFGRQGYRYSGNIKARKPAKGGGSISGKLFNNNGEPLDVRLPGSPEAKAANYGGKIKLPFFRRTYVQNPHASDKSLKKHKPTSNTFLAGGLQVARKEEPYKQKPHAVKNSLPGIGPKNGSVKAAEYAHSLKMYWSYKHNPNSNENALKGIRPPRATGRIEAFAGNQRMTGNHRHNPSSNSRALKVLSPGKAYARINDYQGNSRMRKYNDSRLHPDSQFAHGFRNNTKHDRTLMMNVKLLWAKWFKKNDAQPAIVKEKERKPRYDKKEQDLWKALYD